MNTPDRPPRLVLLTSPSLYGAAVINELADHPHVDMVGVALTNRVYKNQGLIATLRTAIRRMGWTYTRYNILVGNIGWAHLRLRGKPTGLPTGKGRVKMVTDVNDPGTLAWLTELQPDYIASCYFNQWIGADVRRIAKTACVNVHPSLLPALRGPDPLFRAAQYQIRESGVTIHTVDDKFDEGEILCQLRTTLLEDASVFALYLDQLRTGARLLGDWIHQPEKTGEKPGDLSHYPAVIREYLGFPTPDEVRQFVRSGKRLVSLAEANRAVLQLK